MYYTGFTVLLLLFPLTGFADETAYNQCRPIVEMDPQWRVIRIRPHENELITCTLTQEQFNSLIHDAIVTNDSERTNYHSLFIGRLVDHPWLSRYLAVQALDNKGWDTEKGQPKEGDINAFVRELLTAPELLQQVQVPFTGSGYTVVGVSVEKVLVVKANEIQYLEIDEPVLLPYDAMVHFILKQGGDS